MAYALAAQRSEVKIEEGEREVDVEEEADVLPIDHCERNLNSIIFGTTALTEAPSTPTR